MGELCLPWPTGWRSTVPYTQQGNAIMIFEVQNDSIYDGSKGIYDIEDFELVDLFGAYTYSPWDIGDGNLGSNNDDYRKKPHAWRPNTEENGGFEDARDWYHYWRGQPGDGARNPVEMKEDIGNYTFDPITVHMSTVASAAYIVDPGYEGDLEIVGVITGSSVEEVFTNISKADTGQVLSVISSGTGLELDSADLVANGDTLMVVSADQDNMTKYVLAVAAGGLDNDAVLTPKDGSGLTIANTGETGTIEGMTPGTNISDVLAKVESPATATLNIIDADGNLVPLKFLNPDTVMVPTQVLGGIYFESIAQDQKTIITYELVLDISDSEAWVSSNVYSVDQEKRVISLVPEGVTVQLFLANLIPGGDATIELMDITEQSREEGYVVKDDMLKVTSKDESVSVVYTLRVLGAALSTAAYVTSEVYMVNEDQLQISEIPVATEVDAFLANVKPAPGSVIMLTDGSGNPKSEGSVVSGDKLVVTAEDDVTTSTYTVASGSNAASVTSTVYTVNEGLLQISQVPAATAVDLFLTNLTPATGAVAILTDGSGNPKPEGSVVTGDKVVVTAEDNVTTSTYTVDVLVSVRDLVIDRISVYPNPANDVLYIRGVPDGSTVQLTNITGRKLGVYKPNMELFELSVEDLARGYYLISVMDKDQNSKVFRFVKQ